MPRLTPRFAAAAALAAAAITLAPSTHATPVIDVGSHDLLYDWAYQSIAITVAGGDPVQALNLNVQIGDGSPFSTGPALTAVDVVSNTIFAPNNTGPSLGDFLEDHIAARSIITAAGAVNASGLLATIHLSTLGLPGGSAYDLILDDTLNGPTDFADVTPAFLQAPGNLRVLPGYTWNTDDSTTWSDNAHWTGAAPNAAGHSALFTTAITQARSVTLDQNITLGQIRFDAPHAYTIAPLAGQTITLQAPNHATLLRVTAANGSAAHAILANLLVNDDLDIVLDSPASLTLAGAFTITPGLSVRKTGDGNLLLAGAQTWADNSTLHIADGSLTYNINNAATSLGTNVLLDINPGASVTVAGSVDPFSDGTDRLDILNDAALVIDDNATASPQQITGSGNTSVNPGGTLTLRRLRQSSLTIGGIAQLPTSAPLAIPLANPITLPEPASLTLFALATLPLIRRRRRP